MSKLTLEALERWLWDSADLMRGHIDSSDFKNYIFGLKTMDLLPNWCGLARRRRNLWAFTPRKCY